MFSTYIYIYIYIFIYIYYIFYIYISTFLEAAKSSILCWLLIKEIFNLLAASGVLRKRHCSIYTYTARVKICQIPHVNFSFCTILHCPLIQNSSANFKLIHFLLGTKASHQSPNFDTFECFIENLPNFWCHFPNHESVFLRILQHSSMSWKIAPL